MTAPMPSFITADDVIMYAPGLTEDQAADMIAGAYNRALAFAPCLAGTLTDQQTAAARAIFQDALVRRSKIDTGVIKTDSQTVGGVMQSFTVDTTRTSSRPFTAAEVLELQQICGESGTGGLPSGSFPPSCEAVPRAEWAHHWRPPHTEWA